MPGTDESVPTRRNVSQLRDLRAIRREAARVTREGIRGERSDLQAWRLLQSLSSLAGLHRDSELEARVEALEQAAGAGSR